MSRSKPRRPSLSHWQCRTWGDSWTLLSATWDCARFWSSSCSRPLASALRYRLARKVSGACWTPWCSNYAPDLCSSKRRTLQRLSQPIPSRRVTRNAWFRVNQCPFAHSFPCPRTTLYKLTSQWLSTDSVEHSKLGILVLTFLSTPVDQVFVLSCANLFAALTLVEDLSCIGVSIIHANNTMTPSLAQNAFTATKEPLLLPEVFHLRELITQRFYFLASLLGRSQSLRHNCRMWITRVIVEQGCTDLLQSTHVTRGRF